MKPTHASDRRALVEQDALRRIEILIARVLFWGSLLGVTIALAGLIGYFRQDNAGAMNLKLELSQLNSDNPRVFTSVKAIVEAASSSANSLAVVGIGLLVLLSIPVMTVTLTIIAFFRARDYRYAIISTIVLLILLVSFFAGD